MAQLSRENKHGGNITGIIIISGIAMAINNISKIISWRHGGNNGIMKAKRWQQPSADNSGSMA